MCVCFMCFSSSVNFSFVQYFVLLYSLWCYFMSYCGLAMRAFAFVFLLTVKSSLLCLILQNLFICELFNLTGSCNLFSNTSKMSECFSSHLFNFHISDPCNMTCQMYIWRRIPPSPHFFVYCYSK